MVYKADEVEEAELVEEAQSTCPKCKEKVTPDAEGKCPKCGASMEDDEMEEEACGDKKKKKSEAEDETVTVSAPEAKFVETLSVVTKADLETFKEEIKSMFTLPEPEKHPLDEQYVQLKSAYDEIFGSELSADEKLRSIQEPFELFGQAIVKSIRQTEVKQETASEPQNDLVKALSEVMNPIAQKLDLLLAQNSTAKPTGIPQRRSIDPNTVPQGEAKKQQTAGKAMTIHELALKSVGLP